MSYMDIEEIRKKYNSGDYTYQMFVPLSVGDNHIFDENLSVKRNREMVIEHNEMVRNSHKEKQMKNNELLLQMRNEVTKYIAGTYGMSKEQASIVESYVYTEKHSFMCDYFSSIDEVAEMVEKVIRSEM